MSGGGRQRSGHVAGGGGGEPAHAPQRSRRKKRFLKCAGGEAGGGPPMPESGEVLHASSRFSSMAVEAIEMIWSKRNAMLFCHFVSSTSSGSRRESNYYNQGLVQRIGWKERVTRSA